MIQVQLKMREIKQTSDTTGASKPLLAAKIWWGQIIIQVRSMEESLESVGL